MKNLFCIIFLIYSAFTKVSGQTLFVGSSSACGTQNANYTFTTSVATCTHCAWYSADSFSFAIIGTPLTVISFTSLSKDNLSSSAWSKDNSIRVSGTNNVEFALTTNCAGAMCANLATGTPLNNSLNWSAGQSTLYKAIWGSFMSPYTCGTQVNPFYIGFRKILTNDTIYGWVSLDSNLPGNVMQYAMKHTNPSTITPVFTSTLTTVCAGNNVPLSASPQDGFYSGVGVYGDVFSQNISGTYPVYYTINCINTASMNITVNPLPNTILTNTETSICLGDSVILTGSPSGGTFSGLSVTGNVFKPTSVVGSNVVYSYTGGNGCTKSNSKFINVVTCVGIKETSGQKMSFSVFPNPNFGEFEIKGSKEETIFISNDFGQLIEVKTLNAENNYSIKINDLKNGVYCVGNRSSKQKIIVIK